MIRKFYIDYGTDGGGKKKIRIVDNRKRIAATDVPFSDRFSKTGSYDPIIIQNIIKAAKFNGVDPNTALAIALQETGIGNKDPDNIGASNIPPGTYGKAPKGINQDAYELTRLLKDKIAYAKKLGFTDEEHQLQAYNGLGKLFNKGDTIINGVPQNMTFYGKTLKPGESLDLKENPLYGKTIIDLRDNLIKNHPEIQKMIGVDPTQNMAQTKPFTPQQKQEWNTTLDAMNKGATPEQAFDGKSITPAMIGDVQIQHGLLRENPVPQLNQNFSPLDLDGELNDNTRQLYFPTIKTIDKDYGTDIDAYLKDKNTVA